MARMSCWLLCSLRREFKSSLILKVYCQPRHMKFWLLEASNFTLDARFCNNGLCLFLTLNIGYYYFEFASFHYLHDPRLLNLVGAMPRTKKNPFDKTHRVFREVEAGRYRVDLAAPKSKKSARVEVYDGAMMWVQHPYGVHKDRKIRFRGFEHF